LNAQFPAVRCSRCNTAHHDTCWNDNGGHCTVFHCNNSFTAASPFPALALRLAEISLLLAPLLLLLLNRHGSIFGGGWSPF
jgi:hypothetical protein